ncbi:LysR substrate-binding domain-containing protein, partial [Eleftheria terrae]|uniref:LysR substrate-binding domain-containing protein n=1 Tax=Eleftheria terrae TaxID=1597781 RepID=UPI00263A74D7
MDELRAITTFVRAAEYGSFNKAAVAQGTTPQAVSKSIRQLEEHLGVRLFHRTTRKSSLTHEGERLFGEVRANLEEMTAAINRARNAVRDDEGLVRISAGSSAGRKVLMPLVRDFAATYPAVAFDLVLEDRVTDSVAERIDVGFQAGNAPSSQVIARRLFAIQQIVCASPAYLAAHGVPRRLAELQGHRCTGYRQPGTGRPLPWEFNVKGEIVFQPMSPFLRCSDPE